jgi:hypothetical protein
MHSSILSRNLGFNTPIQQSKTSGIFIQQVPGDSCAINRDLVSIQKPQFSGRTVLPELKEEELETLYQRCSTVIPTLDIMVKNPKKTHIENSDIGNFYFKQISTDKKKLVYKVFKCDIVGNAMSQPIVLKIWKNFEQALPTLERIDKIHGQKQPIKDAAKYLHFNYLENTPHVFLLMEYINKHTKKLKHREGQLAKEQNIRFHQGFWNSIGYFFSSGKKKGIQYRYKKLFVDGQEYPAPLAKPSKAQAAAKTEEKKDP